MCFLSLQILMISVSWRPVSKTTAFWSLQITFKTIGHKLIVMYSFKTGHLGDRMKKVFLKKNKYLVQFDQLVPEFWKIK